MARAQSVSEKRYRTFPIVRHGREHKVYLGFKSEQAAHDWVDWGLRAWEYSGPFLVEATKAGAPGKPAPVTELVRPD